MSTIPLLQLPWADLERPSIQLSLISALLNEAGLESRVFYPNIQVARSVGAELYETIKGRLGRLVGEWFFAQALFGDDVPDYLVQIERKLGQSPAFSPGDWGRLREVVQRIPAIIEDCLDAIDDELGTRPRALGISCTHEQLLAALAFSRAVKARHKDCKIVLGGAQVIGSAGHALMEAFEWIDWVVDGEADEVVVPLFRALVTGDVVELPHTSFGVGRGVITPTRDLVISDLDTSPIPDYRDYLAMRPEDVATRVLLPVELSRGCWWRDGKGPCNFCGVCPQTRSYRTKSTERVAREIEQHVNRTWLLDFAATDPVLSKRALEGLRQVQRTIDASLFSMVRPSDDPGAARRLTEAGMRGVLAGIESLDSRLLKLLNKGTTLLDNVGFLKGAATFGLPVSYSVLYGIPGEAVEDYRRIIELIPLIHHLQPPKQLLHLNIERYSNLFEEPETHGITNLRPSSEYDFLFPPDRADVFQIAYLFNGDYSSVAHHAVMNELHLALVGWCEARGAGASLSLRRGAGFVHINDLRDPEQSRSIHIRGNAERVLAACVRPIRRRALRDHVELSEESFEQAIRELDAVGLLLAEDDVLLALPVRHDAPPVEPFEGHTRRLEGGFVLSPVTDD